jgi:hypothetical protein
VVLIFATMKRILLHLPLFALLSIALSTTSCKKDACQGMDCGIHGDCFEGVCSCDPGYLLDGFGQCEDLLSQRIAGTYAATNEGCNIGDYFLTIQANPGKGHGLFIANLGQYTCLNTGGELVINATFSEEARFEIDADAVYCNQYSIIGSGLINADSSITLSYRAEYEVGGGSQLIDNCTVQLVKQ